MSNVYLYQTQELDNTARMQLESYAQQKGFKNPHMVTESADMETQWQERSLGKTVQNAKAGDVIIAFDSVAFTNSANQTLEVLIDLVGRGINLHFAKYNMCYSGEKQSQLTELLALLRKIESDYVSRRNIEAIERRRKMGVVLGRPKGRQNKALKLDKFKKEITRYLELSISKASIAKLVNCHPQTLYDWIERNSIPDRKPRKPRTRKLENA